MDGFHKTANTINGVVINIHGDSHSTKVGKRVRREASFRVPPPPSFNGSGRASSPTLSSNSGSPYPNLPAPPMNSVPVENARARAIQVRLTLFTIFFDGLKFEILFVYLLNFDVLVAISLMVENLEFFRQKYLGLIIICFLSELIVFVMILTGFFSLKLFDCFFNENQNKYCIFTSLQKNQTCWICYFFLFFLTQKLTKDITRKIKKF